MMMRMMRRVGMVSRRGRSNGRIEVAVVNTYFKRRKEHRVT